MTLNFSTATLEARQQWNNAYKLHKKNNLLTRLLELYWRILKMLKKRQ